MKGKMIGTLIALTLVLSCCTPAPSPEKSIPPAATAEPKKALNVVFFANGNFGDNGYFDTNRDGMLKAEKELGIKVKLIEGGTTLADYKPALEALAASKEYDVIISITGQTRDIISELAKKYPDQNFFCMDTQMKEVPANVYNAFYDQNAGSFIAGAFAALVTTSTDPMLPGANPEKVVGAVGVMESPIINDFFKGYTDGVKYIDPTIEIVTAYIGSPTDAPKAKELALAMYEKQKADIVFNVGASAGLGTLEAGQSVGKYTIGVDKNQNDIYPGSVLTSMIKKSGEGLFRALKRYQSGELKMGTQEVLGIGEDCIGLAKDDLYKKYVPKYIQDKIDEIEKKVASGEIETKSDLY